MEFKIPVPKDLPDIDDPNHYNEDPLLVGLARFVDMAYWYPLVSDLDFVPKTVLTKVPYRIYLKALDAIDSNRIDDAKDLLRPFLTEAIEEIKKSGRIFVRSFFFSAKHEVTSVEVKDEKQLWDNVFNIIYETCMRSISFEGFATRQFLDLKYEFKAFAGLPIAREVRVFATREQVCECDNCCEIKYTFSPYWPKRAIIFFKECQEIDGWQDKLDKLNTQDSISYSIIKNLAELVYDRISKDHPNWSLDFAQDISGKWWFIDCAPAETSWRPNESDFT